MNCRLKQFDFTYVLHNYTIFLLYNLHQAGQAASKKMHDIHTEFSVDLVEIRI